MLGRIKEPGLVAHTLQVTRRGSQRRLPGGGVTRTEPRGMSTEREDGEEEQRDQATTSLAPSGSNAAAACSVPLDRGQAAAPQEAVSVELPTSLFFWFMER